MKERREAGKQSTHFEDKVSEMAKRYGAKGDPLKKKKKKKTSAPAAPQVINTLIARRKT